MIITLKTVDVDVSKKMKNKRLYDSHNIIQAKEPYFHSGPLKKEKRKGKVRG